MAPLLARSRLAGRLLGTARALSAATSTPASTQLAAIKALREASGAPMGDVKAALVEAGWDADGAFAALRKKGLAAAQKKASRHAAEGLVGLSISGLRGALVEINSETDFAARNEAFTSLVSAAAAAALTAPTPGPAGGEVGGGVLGTLASTSSSPDHLAAAVTSVAGTVRENIVLRRGARLDAVAGGVLGSYIHAAAGPGLGRMAALVALAPAGGGDAPLPPGAAGLAARLAMHVVASRPVALDRASVPTALVDAERAVLTAQAIASGKPGAVAAKMVEGRLGKWFEAAALADQPFVVDDSKKVGAVVREAGLRLTGFVRLQVGEGLDAKSGGDFAAEVAETLAKAAG